MTDQIRESIKDHIDTTNTNKILITHGTDTMVETAEFLLRKYNDKPDKAILLTGAMFPLLFHPSDAGFNLGYALAKLESLEPNIYICMNTKIFTAGTVIKNKEQGLFEKK